MLVETHIKKGIKFHSCTTTTNYKIFSYFQLDTQKKGLQPTSTDAQQLKKRKRGARIVHFISKSSDDNVRRLHK